MPLETAKRLTCDGSTVTMINNAKGEPLSVGRKMRTVPTAMNRALENACGRVNWIDSDLRQQQLFFP